MIKTVSILGLAALIAAGVIVLLSVAVGPSRAFADDRGLMPDTMIQWGDYDQFQLPGPGGGRACAQACAHDPRCRAWTFIRPVSICRLKHAVGVAVPNPCCISGVKPDADIAEIGGKQGYCADYARRGIDAYNQNLSQGCQLRGPRWTPDFQAHYSWCMGVDRRAASAETDARAAEIARCTVSASEDSAAKCDHYARISTVQIDTARKAHCDVGDKDRLWTGDAGALKAMCMRAPGRVLPADIETRETVLAACLASAGQSEAACGSYVEVALRQVQEATADSCGFVGRTWTTSRAQHLQWCLDASPSARKAESDSRSQQIASCTQQAAKRKTCDDYTQTALQQSQGNDSQNCGFTGDNWSRYQDDHMGFCMQANDDQLRAETANRDAALQQCQARHYVNPECDEYAKHAVQLAEINQQRHCDNDGDLWSLDYADQYKVCMQTNPGERRDSMIERRQAVHACSADHGFRLELGF